MAAIPKVTLNSGKTIPIVGLGTWKSKPGEVETAVKAAIDAGYRHIDCALAYQNETEVGDAIQTKINEGVVKREDLFVTSKLWNTFHHPNDVRDSLMGTLKCLKTDYVDLYLIHWPQGYVNGKGLFPKDEAGKFIYSDDDYVDTWKSMEKIQQEGLARSIGVSNFNEHQIDRIIKECSIPPANNQVESHPYLTNEKLLNFCKSRGVSMTAYSPLGSPDRPWATANDPVVMEDPKLKEIAKRLDRSTAQVLIRYQIQRGVIVVPKSVTPSRIESNFKVFDFELSDDDMQAIGALNRDVRGCHLNWVSDHKYWPFRKDYSE